MGARRRGVAAVVAAGLGLVLAGCGAGQDALTSANESSVPGVNARTEDDSILVRNAYVVFEEQGYPAGGQAPVRLWLYNQTDRPIRLAEATSPGADGAASVDTGGTIEVPAAGLVEAVLQVSGLRAGLSPAGNLPLALRFDNGADLALELTMAPPLENLPREPMDLSDH
jgi:hypothetical protein